MDHVLDNAVARCPFLANVAASEGMHFARSIALNPLVPASHTPGVRRPVLEELDDYQHTFRLWHGSSGVYPLPGISAPSAPPAAAACPRTSVSQPARPIAPRTDEEKLRKEAPTAGLRQGSARPLPLATMSLSFGDMPDFGKLFRAIQQHTSQPRRPQAQQKPTRKIGPDSARHAPAPASSASSSTAGGGCPLRKILGPLAPVVFNPKGHLVCPEVIVKARAALAATKPVRELRPQSLGTKLLAVGATTAAVNVPCGMVREHTEKFSFGWFVSVHASIPFIAMLRKAVIMPKYAIIYTIATAIAGQAMGAKLERERLSGGKPKLVVSKGDSGMVAAPAVARLTPEKLPATCSFSMEGSRPATRTVRVSKATRQGHGRRTANNGASSASSSLSALVPHKAAMHAPAGALVAVTA